MDKSNRKSKAKRGSFGFEQQKGTDMGPKGDENNDYNDLEVDDDPPKPVSSDEEQDENDDNKKPAVPATGAAVLSSSNNGGGSRIFSPYRTLGIVSSGRPFDLIPNDHSGNALIALPIGDRYQLMRSDHLRPALVSQSVPGNGKQEISCLVSDATLSICVVAHGKQPQSNTATTTTSTQLSNYFAHSVTLFHRTLPLQSKRLIPNNKKQWCIQTLLHLGRIKMAMSGEKEGKLENAAVVAAILRKLPQEQDDGDDYSDSDNSSKDETNNESTNEYHGKDNSVSDDQSCQVVILIATRQDIRIEQRISLKTLPTFIPICALHPSTYLNKIVLGGYDMAENRSAMVLLNIRSGKIVHNFACLVDEKSQIATLSQSPAVDTIAVGTNQGKVHLVNLRHDKRLFSLDHQTASGKPVLVSSISFRNDSSALQYATAPMAVGRADGTITIWDLTPPEDVHMGRTILTELKHVHAPGGISKLQFLPQEPLLLSTGTGSNSILMHIFDNPDHSGRILRQRKGHTAPPRCIRYIHPGAGAGGGILANTSDGTDAMACQILSSGGPDRTLRVFSTARTVVDKEYGQGKGLTKKAKKLGLESTTELLLPPLIAMAACEARSRDWGDLVTIHEDHALSYVWSTRRGAQSGPVLRQSDWNVSAMKAAPPSHAAATSVAISACGNFALVGSRGGRIYKYNLQSGIPRGSYPKQEGTEKKNRALLPGHVGRAIQVLEKGRKVSSRLASLDQAEMDAEQKDRQAKTLQKKLDYASHLGFAVTGLAVDALNKTLVSVGTDGKLILWNFVSHYPHKKSPFQLPAPAAKLNLVRDSGLAAIALNDYSVLMFDTSTQTIIRRFGIGGFSRHQGPISDLAFSPDARSLYTASMDSTIRVWDVPTNSCVDWLKFKTPPTSITVSPTGEFIATAHVSNLGLSIWSDKSFYETVYTDGEPPKEPAKMDEPTPLSDTWDQAETVKPKSSNKSQSQAYQKQRAAETGTHDEFEGPPVPKEEGLVTMSGLAPSHWNNLFHLELVKERNKPTEAPKKPPSAPFFLQWRRGESLGGADGGNDEQNEGILQDDDNWAAAWSDEEEDEGNKSDGDEERVENKPEKRPMTNLDTDTEPNKKRRRIGHSRSHLASLLRQCDEAVGEDKRRFKRVTEYISTLGPSGIDVALSTLCSGEHDLEEGLPLLLMASEWLLEEVQSRERFETVNAYLHRFLYLHASTISGIQEMPLSPNYNPRTVSNPNDLTRQRLLRILKNLRQTHWEASNNLRNKMQRVTCLLRHFSRMV